MLTTRLEFVIPGVPMASARARTTGNHHYVTQRQKAYRRAAGLLALRAMAGRGLFTGPVALAMVAVFEPPASWTKAKRAAALAGEVVPVVKPDWDNLGKIVSDAMNEVVYKDDAQIFEAHVSKRYGEMARVEVAVIGRAA
jgi:Holliday junction resolvase RusA-like endonuclease